MSYELVMGLEVHVELATNSKIFCTCSAKFGADANENVCPACAGMPGLLPVMNKRVVELAVKAGLVTNCEISRYNTFEKKNYFYPDLSTGYQITQLFSPICKGGHIEVETSEGKRTIRINRIHMEEDAGKLVHEPWTDSSLVDYNRASVPLVEIVSEADFRSADEVISYLEKLRQLLTFAGVSDCKMNEGSMRCDVNLSVRKAGEEKFGTRTEMKNMNSLRAIAKAIEYEAERHIDALTTGCEKLVQETRRWDDAKGMSFSMRNKENATDYRYFPNPDIMPVIIDDEWFEQIKSSLPELAHEKNKRLVEQYGLPQYDADIITSSKNLSDIFDETVKHCDNPKEVSNWLLGELMSTIKGETTIEDVKIDGAKIAGLIKLVIDKTINRATAKEIFAKIYKEDIDPQKYVEENGLGMINDEGLIIEAAKQALNENEKLVTDYKNGNTKVFGRFVGVVMKKTEGKADPALVNEILQKLLQ